jgi:hypothetical protein
MAHCSLMVQSLSGAAILYPCCSLPCDWTMECCGRLATCHPLRACAVAHQCHSPVFTAQFQNCLYFLIHLCTYSNICYKGHSYFTQGETDRKPDNRLSIPSTLKKPHKPEQTFGLSSHYLCTAYTPVQINNHSLPNSYLCCLYHMRRKVVFH